MTAYYNEIDPFAAQWLRNLIAAGHIAPGTVDTRSIVDVTPSDLRGFTQCHFFAGIGVWSLALRRAGWGDDRACWTGSCPCQPFSAAGKGGGFADERHLWPAWHHLIGQCRPPVVFGEQVASKRESRCWSVIVLASYTESRRVVPCPQKVAHAQSSHRNLNGVHAVITVHPYDLVLDRVERDANGCIIGGWVVNGNWWFQVSGDEHLCMTSRGGSVVTRHPACPLRELNESILK